MPIAPSNQITVFTLAARTSTANSADQTTNGGGVRLFLNITAVSGTSPTLDLKVQVKDTLGAVYTDLPNASFAQKTAAGTDELTIYPGITTSANRAVSSVLSDTWRIVATIAGTTPSFTFSISAAMMQ